ncbi:MAG: SLC13 family permease [Planctomycetota bacterium]
MFDAWEPWAVAVVLAATLLALVRAVASPDVLLVGALTLLAGLGLFSERLPDPASLVAGFGSEGLITVAALFVVAAGLTQTGATYRLTATVLGRPKSTAEAIARLTIPVTTLSGFMNNTPVVAMLLPVVRSWARRCGVSPSKLLIPLSYAAILGGTCTLIGTSTNLIVADLLRQSGPDAPRLGLFSLAWVGLPAAVLGVIYLLTLGRKLLPDRPSVLAEGDDVRRYTVQMQVDPGSPLAGKSIEQAGLRRLPGLYLLEIDRLGEVLAAVGPEQVLHVGDILVFVGVVDSVVDLRNLRGLSPATDEVAKIDGSSVRAQLVEAVVSPACPLVGRSIREGRFRTYYNAAVIAVARDGQRLKRKLGDVVLRAGDTLLLETQPGFADQQRNRRDFFLVSQLDGATPTRHAKAPLAIAVFALLVIAMGFGWVHPIVAALWGAALMWLTRCVTGAEARRSLDGQVLIVIGAAIGLGQAVLQSGLAGGVSSGILGLVGDHPLLALAAIYLLTNLFTELVTNNAAAVLMFPIAGATAATLGVDATPFAVAVMMAASAAFATPIGYQTNLMVLGPGGYRFTDYVKVGIPLNVIVFAVTMAVTPWAFPFVP